MALAEASFVVALVVVLAGAMAVAMAVALAVVSAVALVVAYAVELAVVFAAASAVVFAAALAVVFAEGSAVVFVVESAVVLAEGSAVVFAAAAAAVAVEEVAGNAVYRILDVAQPLGEKLRSLEQAVVFEKALGPLSAVSLYDFVVICSEFVGPASRTTVVEMVL